MAKKTKITIIMDQPLFPESKNILLDILSDRQSLGYYTSFNKHNVVIEEVDDIAHDQSDCCAEKCMCDACIAWRDHLAQKENK